MTHSYKAKVKEMVQVIGYLSSDEKERFKKYCYENGFTVSGLIRKQILNELGENGY